MSGKWIEIENLRRPAAEVAAEIIRQRAEYVREMLPLAAYEYRHDSEHVHQLRVGCRRTGAALQAFRPLLGRKAKRLKKWLKKIRRAAGPARDTDVLLERIEDHTGPSQKYVVARLKSHRKTVQESLLHVAKRAEKSARFERDMRRCVKALKHKSSRQAAERFDTFARTALRRASQEMFQRAGVRKPTIVQLHQLRIAGKRLRYSIELFHSAFHSSLVEEVYPLVEKIQSRLGQLNDHATAQAMFQDWLTDLPPNKRAAQLAARIVTEHQVAEKIRADFLHWWTPKRVAALESHLSELIHERN